MQYVGWVIAVILACLAGYWSGYSKKKGENRAIHEDIQKILDDLRLTTKATEEIKTQISSEVWDRQRQWEMKREVVFEAARKAMHITDAFARLNSVYATDELTRETGGAQRFDERVRMATAWNEAIAGFHGMAVIVASVCSNELWKVTGDLGQFISDRAEEILEKNHSTNDKTFKEIGRRNREVAMCMRKELGVVDAATPQSTEPSATPTPAAPTPE